MRKIIYVIALFAINIGINAQTFHGKKIAKNKKSIEAKSIEDKIIGNEKVKLRVTGIVEDVCQAAGCWMKIKTNEGKTMRVTFKDYAFFVPKDIAGKRVTFEGTASKTETSVEHLKHYAQDAGKTETEIAKITKPEYAITFEAIGVFVEN